MAARAIQTGSQQSASASASDIPYLTRDHGLALVSTKRCVRLSVSNLAQQRVYHRTTHTRLDTDPAQRRQTKVHTNKHLHTRQ